MELLKGIPSHCHHLKIQVQQWIQEYSKAVNQSDKGSLDSTSVNSPAYNPQLQLGPGKGEILCSPGHVKKRDRASDISMPMAPHSEPLYILAQYPHKR